MIRFMHTIEQLTTTIEIFTDTQSDKFFSIKENTEFNYLAILYENAQINFTIYCDGKNSKANIKILCIGQGHHHIQSNIMTSLNADYTQADVYILSLLNNWSDINVHGNITLSPNVKKVSWHLLEENIILGKKIKIRTAPILDVRSNDVSASHGCRVEKIDPKRLFYMQSRWLTPSESQSLILDGYLNTMLEWFDDENNTYKNKIKTIITQ